MIMRVREEASTDTTLQPSDVVNEIINAIDSANDELRRLNLEVRGDVLIAKTKELIKSDL